LYEKNLPTEEAKKKDHSRFFGPHGLQNGKGRYAPPSPQGTQETDRLMPLPAAGRLPRERITESGVRRQFAYGSLKLLPPPLGAAVVVSKKVFKTAPLRNRIRRRISSLLTLFIREGVLRSAVVVYPNASALRASFPRLTEALRAAVSS
jgi:RNase P protein component